MNANVSLQPLLKSAFEAKILYNLSTNYYQVLSSVMGVLYNMLNILTMGSGHIREPSLVNRWPQGDRKPAKCISCNSCFKPGLEEGGIYCVVEKKEQEKAVKR